ncbi:MAG: EVE domain-containing protein [Ideonella sp. WA131b]|jgi:hypothetical protein|nr:EVE domain-containing protein [Ideonella sp. WA131b]
MSANWVAVASAEHVAYGRETGFMQVCHGKAAPLRRVHPGDRVVYYSPCSAFRGKDKLQSFTAIGVVQAGEPYEFDMGGGFRPFRRNVTWFEAIETPIQPLLNRLEFSSGVRNWGYQFRFGLFAISGPDMDIISSAMRVPVGA